MRALLLFLCFAGCESSGTQEYIVNFAATVSGLPFACGQTYSGIGTTSTTIVPQDLRFFVHDVGLHASDGTRWPMTLYDDGVWQHGDVTLLDFEDGTFGCATNSPAMNKQVSGTAMLRQDYVGVDFTIGVPISEDALSVVDAPAPLNLPAMFWSWVGGYKFMKIEVGSTGNPVWYFHLGADTCSAVSLSTLTCKYPDESTVTLSGWSPTATINLDLARLYADSDLDAQVNGTTDTIPGCMSTAGDPECPPLYDKVGLSFESAATPPTQTLFQIQ
jgi:uncharacterized repeat protein (TIGR04052 family)